MYVKTPTMANKPNHRFIKLEDGDYCLANVLGNLYNAMTALRKKEAGKKGVGMQGDDYLSNEEAPYLS